jgi:Ca2+-binding EF-hand superfamily protein
MDQVSESQIRRTLQNVFQDIDRNKSGFLDLREVEEALRRFSNSPECTVKWDNAKITGEARVSVLLIF